MQIRYRMPRVIQNGRTLFFAVMLLATPARSVPPAIHLEAESGTLEGVTVATDVRGFSGTGYVTGFTKDGTRVSFTFDGTPGLYEVRLRYRAASGDKKCDISINGAKITGDLTATAPTVFAETDLGKVELKAGRNTLSVEKGWGWWDFDAIDLVPTKPGAPPRRPPKTLIDAKATPATQALFARLVDLYGKTTLSGQMDEGDADYIRTVIGKYPAILGSDFIDFSASRMAHGANLQGQTERVLNSVATNKAILTLMWHWNAPTDLLDTPENRWWSGFYTKATTFDLAEALAHPDSPKYRLLLQDMDTIASELKKVAAAGVPVLWRPLHEAEGKWFWWGAKGPEPFKQLWRLMYDRFTSYHGLHNLIWVYSSGTDPAWYPGDNYVDIVGIDAYPSDYTDPLTGTWETLQKRFNGKKLLALTEFGKVPDIAKMRRSGVYWSYFSSWTGDLGPKGVSKAELVRLYNTPSITNRLPGQ